MIDGTNATNETENYGYPQFVAEDKPGWLTDWNKTMEAIDANEAGIQTQVTENKEDLEALEMTVERHEEELHGETGAFQQISDNRNRIQDLEEKVGDDEHGLVKDMIDVKRDLTETNTMAVKTNGAVNSIRDLICNPFVSTSQYNAGAYVYLQDADDGEIHYYKCNTTHRGAFNPDHFDDVTEKLITALDNSGGGSGSQYVLPVAGSADDVDPLLGGVIIGDGLVIDPETGVLSTEGGGGGGGDVPYASKLQAGIMKPGNGLSDGHDNGTVDVMVDNDTIIIDSQTGRLRAQKSFSPQDLPTATDDGSVKGVVTGKTSFDSTQGKVNIDNNGALSVAIDNDYIKRKTDGSLTVNPEKIGSASGINVGAGLNKPNSNTIALTPASTGTPGGILPDPRSFKYEGPEVDGFKKISLQLADNSLELSSGNTQGYKVKVKPNGGIGVDSEGLYATGGGGGGTTYTEGDGIDITNGEISVKIKQNGGLAFDNGELYATGGGGTGSSILINPTLIAGYRSDDDPRASMGAGVYLETDQDISAYNNLGYHIPTANYNLFVVKKQYDISEPFSWIYEEKQILQGVTHKISVTRTAVSEGEYSVVIRENSYDASTSEAINFEQVSEEIHNQTPQTLNFSHSESEPSWCSASNLQEIDLYVGNGINGLYEFNKRNHIILSRTHSVTLYKAIPGATEGTWVRDTKLFTLKPNSIYRIAGAGYPSASSIRAQQLYTKDNVIDFEDNSNIPYINILDNGNTVSSGGVSNAAKYNLQVPYSYRGRKCMLFFPYSLKVGNYTPADNPFNNKSWTGYSVIVSYTLAFANMPGEAATVGTYVPFYHRDIMIGSDNFSFVQQDGTITIRDWLADTYGTSDPDTGEVKQPYGSVLLDCCDAREIALFVTVRRCDVSQGSGTLETYTTRQGNSGNTSLIESVGDLVLVPIDNTVGGDPV